MNQVTTILVFVILLYVPKMVSAQEFSTNQFKVLQSGTSSTSTIVALVDQETLHNPSLVFNQEQLTTHNTSAYLFINTISLETLYTELNHLIRSNTSGFNKNALQLIIMGSQNELERYELLDPSYFSSHYFVSSDNSEASQTFTTIKNSDWNGEVYLESVKGKYLWGIDKHSKRPKDSLINRDEGKLTLGYRPATYIGLKNNNLGNYFTNGLSLDYSIRKNIQLYAAAHFAIQRPKIEDEIQNQIRGQIDIFDIINGTTTEQDVTLSVPISSKLYATASLGLNYLFTPDKDFSFYVSTELSTNSSINTSGQLDTTFTVAFNGSNPNNFSTDNIDEEAIGIEQREAVNINPGIGIGIQLKLGGHFRFDLSAAYSTSIKSLSVSDSFNNNAIRIGAGLHFRFKDKRAYESVYFY